VSYPAGLEALSLAASALLVLLLGWAGRVVWTRLSAGPRYGSAGAWRTAIAASAVLSLALGAAGALPEVTVRKATTFFTGPDLLSGEPERVDEVSRRWTVPGVGLVRHLRATQGNTLLREEQRAAVIPPLPLLVLLAAALAVTSGGGQVRRPRPTP
jgi:hypothetical protein